MKSTYPAYPYSDEDVKSEIAQLFWLDYPKTHPFDEFHSHNYYEIFVFFEGGGTHNINFTEYGVANNSIHLLAPNHLHWLERGIASKGFFIIYKEEFLQKLAFINPHIPYTEIFSSSKIIDLPDHQITVFAHLFRELEQNNDNSVYMLSIIGTFLTKIALTFSIKNTETYRYDALVAQAIQLINKHCKARFTVDQYAEMLCTSTGTLRKKVKKHTGKSIKQLQQDRLLKEAKRLLHHPDYTISEVAFQLGFKQPAHFSTWFKKHTQNSPKQMKE